ncbi:MAG: peptidylprolyl isomerase [Marmoricola sp.]|nr:peptidylprolyl isomerase [Marmoricola sp.]
MLRSLSPRRLAPIAVLVAATLALAGCGSSEDAKKPTSSTPPADLVLKVLKPGTGATVAVSDTVTVDYQGSIFATGKVFDQSYGDAPRSFTPSGVVPGFGAALVGQKVGTQLIVSIPPAQGYGTAGNEQAGISGTDTIVFVVDIKSTKPAALNCSITSGTTSDAVKVTGKFGAVPKPTYTKPIKATKIERTILKTGTGAAAKVDELVTARISIFNARTGKKIQSQSGQIQAGSAATGDVFGAGIACIKSGSRVVTTVPATETPGAIGKDVKKTDTLVLITDLSKVDPAPASTLPPTKDWTDAPEVTFNGSQAPKVALPALQK